MRKEKQNTFFFQYRGAKLPRIEVSRCVLYIEICRIRLQSNNFPQSRTIPKLQQKQRKCIRNYIESVAWYRHKLQSKCSNNYSHLNFHEYLSRARRLLIFRMFQEYSWKEEENRWLSHCIKITLIERLRRHFVNWMSTLKVKVDKVILSTYV